MKHASSTYEKEMEMKAVTMRIYKEIKEEYEKKTGKK